MIALLALLLLLNVLQMLQHLGLRLVQLLAVPPLTSAAMPRRLLRLWLLEAHVLTFNSLLPILPLPLQRTCGGS